MSCLSLMLAISMHVGLTGDYNNIHPHARCQQDSLISGVYYNSEEKRLMNRLMAICPTVSVKDGKGNHRYFKPFYYIRYD